MPWASVADVNDPLERGREACVRRAWIDAFECLSTSDADMALGAEDLELLATAAYMVGRDDAYANGLERAYHAHVDAGNPARAARSAFWAGLRLHFRGATGGATGWYRRAQRLLDREELDCAERGYLLELVICEHAERGDFESVHSTALDAARIGERHRDRDLNAMAVHEQGRALVKLGRVAEGLALAGRSDGGGRER